MQQCRSSRACTACASCAGTKAVGLMPSYWRGGDLQNGGLQRLVRNGKCWFGAPCCGLSLMSQVNFSLAHTYWVTPKYTLLHMPSRKRDRKHTSSFIYSPNTTPLIQQARSYFEFVKRPPPCQWTQRPRKARHQHQGHTACGLRRRRHKRPRRLRPRWHLNDHNDTAAEQDWSLYGGACLRSTFSALA